MNKIIRTQKNQKIKDSKISKDTKMSRLGHFVVNKRRMLLILSIFATLVFGVIGSGTLNALSLSRFDAPGSESDLTAKYLQEQFNTATPSLILLVTAKQGDVDSQEVTMAAKALEKELAAKEGISEVQSYWTHGNSPALRSNDHQQAIIFASMKGSVTEIRNKLADWSPQFFRENETIKMEAGGPDELFRQVGEQARQDFLRAEIVILPAVLLLLIFVYRRILPALLTIGIGLFSILGTFAVLRGLTEFIMVSTFATNLTLVMGLALGIDYSLFMIIRYREERQRGKSVHEAVVKSVATAGRTIWFSGITVAVSLSALLMFSFPFLRSFAYAGLLVVITAAIGATVILPAALAVFGKWIDRKHKSGNAVKELQEYRFWYRLTMRVMKRPVFSILGILVILMIIGSPFLDIRFGLPDERVLPDTASSRIVEEKIRSNFPAEEDDAVRIVAPSIENTSDRFEDIEQYSVALSKIPGIFQVDSLAGSFADGQKIMEPGYYSKRYGSETGTWLSVIPDESSLNGEVAHLVGEIKAEQAPFDVVYGGSPVEITDFRDSLLNRLPLVIAFIIVVTFVILFLMNGSLLIPLKATILNILSLSVMFGALVWIFQEGNLSNILGFTPLDSIEPSIPILMFCIAYGLSMDYEVFIMSRIKEEYDRTGDNTKAVAAGIQRSAPLASAAAAIMALSFAAYATGEVVFLKMLGIGMALAVIVDATLIRAILAPALMKLAGNANWWVPKPLKRLYEIFNLSETE
ncbi:MMPL family transporter [Niallia sp. 01092]|uniref:MMPL family transporter n=1 Tax=unclassified Niallia TaxID=2837522 RepID=UPI003FCF4F67